MPVTFEIEEDPSAAPRRAAAKPSLLSRLTGVSTKLLFSTGRAAWVTGTTLLILVVPLIIEMDREAQLMEMESQAMGVLAGAPAGGAAGGEATSK